MPLAADMHMTEKVDGKSQQQETTKVVKVKRYKLNPVKFFLKATYWILFLAFLSVLFYVLFQAFDTWYRHYLETKG